MTTQPVWSLVSNLGDASPLEYGGYFVYVDSTGVYPPEAELLVSPEEGPEDDTAEAWEVRRFILEPCKYVQGILSDNPSHPECPVWFADKLGSMADTFDTTEEDLRALFISADPVARAQAWRMVGEYFGFEELDSYPLRFTRAEVEKRYPEFV
jgi:hypothetical protein